MAFNSSKKLADNKSAIEIALNYIGQQLSPEEIKALENYSGFGGIKAIMFPPGTEEDWQKYDISQTDLKMHAEIMALHKMLQHKLSEADYKRTYASIVNSVATAFYTPDFIPGTIFSALKNSGIFPKRIYEPSAGSGIFVTEALRAFPELEMINAVEKDLLTGRILSVLAQATSPKISVQVKGLEETAPNEKGMSDLIISNIPFGNFSVHDPAFNGSGISSRIHNYFFAKGLDKLADGGILVYLVTDGFLNSPSNDAARKYLLTSADLISVSVLPANLMKENANVEVGTHLLIVQKNDTKETLSEAEKLLIGTVEQSGKKGTYYLNAYLAAYPGLMLGDEVIEDTNNYGQANIVVWQNADIRDILPKLKLQITNGLAESFDYTKWQAIQFVSQQSTRRKFTFLPVPEVSEGNAIGQLGLFDAIPVENNNKAQSYLDEPDRFMVDGATARQISTIRTTARPTHDSIVLLTARSKANARYLYKLFSNVAELSVPAKWLSGISLGNELDILSAKLRNFAYDFRYEGDTSLEQSFKLFPDRPKAFTDLKQFYEKGALVLFEGKAGLIGEPLDGQATFTALEIQADLSFYRAYIPLRDTYLQLYAAEAEHKLEFPELRKALQHFYDAFTRKYGELNKAGNGLKILADAAFGFKIRASLERKENETFVTSDIFRGPVFPQEHLYSTSDPGDALARCLNDIGRVDIGRIGEMTGLAEEEVIFRLEKQILLNPEKRIWETTDSYLSGNVVAKLQEAEKSAEADPENFQVLRSLTAIRRVQPQLIPFELLDFNLGERWLPLKYYEAFATELFNLETEINYFPSVDMFKVTYGKGNTTTDAEYAVVPKQSDRITGRTLLEHALENTTPHITYPTEVDGKLRRVPDTEAIQTAHRKIEQIRGRYNDWLKELPVADKQLIEKLYNDTFNCYVLREYDGSHLRFPGLDLKALKIDDLYSSQKDAAWRIMQNRGALVDHEVGLGKTLTMVVAAMEMKRLGIIHKPMILALNIAILSGDTTLLEKTKIEKKVAELESFKSSHFKEVAGSRYLLENTGKKRDETAAMLVKLEKDEAAYLKVLRTDGKGQKLNPLVVPEIHETDQSAIGKWFIGMYKEWKPEFSEHSEYKLGELYNFKLMLNRQSAWVQTETGSKFEMVSSMYAESKDTGIKYMRNNGIPNMDNPKTAAKYFLHAIDNVSSLAVKYRDKLKALEKEIPIITELTKRPFEQESKLVALKTVLAELETKIAQSIAEKQREADIIDLYPDDNDEAEDLNYGGIKR